MKTRNSRKEIRNVCLTDKVITSDESEGNSLYVIDCVGFIVYPTFKD